LNAMKKIVREMEAQLASASDHTTCKETERSLVASCEAHRIELAKSSALQTDLEKQLANALKKHKEDMEKVESKRVEAGKTAANSVAELQTKLQAAEERAAVATRSQQDADKMCRQIREEADEHLTTLKAAHTQQLLALTDAHPSKIAYRSLAPGDLALFFPTTTGFFVAFTDGNDGSLRHHYLSSSTMEALDVRVKKPEWIVLELVEISRHQASAEYNPYKLPIGTRFAELQGMRAT